MLDGGDVPKISLGWDEGKYFDLWMIVHTLTGVMIGTGAYMLGLSPMVSYVGTFVGLTLYEVVEEVFKIEETIENRLADIVFGSIGFVSFYQFVSPLISQSSKIPNQILFTVVGFLVIVAVTTGWWAYERRS
jgi:hypothetical protein